jgi:hypothetical protein
MRSKLDVKIGAGRRGLARENQAVSKVVGLQDVAPRHVDLALDDGRHARTAPAFAARVGCVNARVEQHVDQRLAARPAQPVSLTIQLDFDVSDF